MVMLQAVLHWFARIMWHGFRRYLQITQVKTITRPDEHTTGETRKLATGCSACSEENGEIVGSSKRANTAAMIPMLMGYQNRVNIVSGDLLRGKT
jgi:cytochrome c553